MGGALRRSLRSVPDRHAHQQTLESPSLGLGGGRDAANDPGARGQPAARLSRSGRLVRAHDPRGAVLALVRGVGSLRARARQSPSAGMGRRSIGRSARMATSAFFTRPIGSSRAPTRTSTSTCLRSCWAGSAISSRRGELEQRARTDGATAEPRGLIAAEAGFRQTHHCRRMKRCQRQRRVRN